MICTYLGLFVSIRRTRGQTPLANPNDMDFVFRFFFIVLTNIMCWAPVYVLRLLVLLKYPVPGITLLAIHFLKRRFLYKDRFCTDEVSIWVVVFVVPINAAIDPFLYTFTTPKFRRLLAQIFSGARARSLSGSGRYTNSSFRFNDRSCMQPMIPLHQRRLSWDQKLNSHLEFYRNASLPTNAAQHPNPAVTANDSPDPADGNNLPSPSSGRRNSL